jgi:glycosyltransferase involved in cell wall biosynthesis
MTSPRISVLMTAFNRQDYIADAIESVLGQTFTDFELLIVDDRSADGTLAVARAYEARDSRVRVAVNPENLGDYANRNRAASLARGEFLKYHDSDDVMYPHCLQTMVQALVAEPRADFALTTSRAWAGGPTPMLLTPRMCYAREFLGEGMFHGGPACALFRRASFERLGPFPLRGTISDYHFWVQACRRAYVLLVAGDLFWYRVHDGQSMLSPAGRRDRAAQEGAAWAALFHPDCPLGGDELEQARRNRLTGVVRRALRDLLTGDPRFALDRLRATGARPRDWVRYVGGRRIDHSAGTPAVESTRREPVVRA